MGRQGILNGVVGFAVGLGGGLIGLGGAELRLPYLVGVLGLVGHLAVPLNLAISLVTILAALAARGLVLPTTSILPYLPVALAITAGAVLAAWFGAAWLHRLSGRALARLIFVLLVALGAGLLVEAVLPWDARALVPTLHVIQLAAGFAFGLVIGGISSVLGVAGGEVIIPTLVFGYGIAIKEAGSLALLISLPTVVSGIVNHVRRGSFGSRAAMTGIVLPMGIGSALGAIVGGLLAVYVAGGLIKGLLGLLLIWSAWKVFAHNR